VAIEIDDDVVGEIESGSGDVTLMVSACSDRAAAARAIHDLIADIWQMPNGGQFLGPGDPLVCPGPNFMSGPHESPDGPYFYLDGHALLPEALASIPTVLARHLTRSGVREARIVIPEPVEGPEVQDAEPGVLLYLLPGPDATELPAAWLDAAVGWLGGARGDLYVDKDFLGYRLDVPAAQALARRPGDWVRMVGQDRDWELRGVNIKPPIVTPYVALGIGGNRSEAAVVQAAEQLIDLGRVLAVEAAYAFVTIDPALVALFDSEWGEDHYGPQVPVVGPSGDSPRASGERHRARDDWGAPPPRWSSQPGVPEDLPRGRAREAFDLPDVLVADAFPWQVLGPRHVARMGELPANAVPLGRDRWELAIGDPGDWASPAHAGPIIALGRQLLSPFVLTDADLGALYEQRRQRR
jgi:hypothetical protein